MNQKKLLSLLYFAFQNVKKMIIGYWVTFLNFILYLIFKTNLEY